jgi:hypothetical protein
MTPYIEHLPFSPAEWSEGAERTLHEKSRSRGCGVPCPACSGCTDQL